MRTDGCAQVSAPASTRREARLLVPEAAEYACNGGAGALRGAGDALGRARACRGVLDVLDRLGDVGGDDLHLGHLLLSHVCCEPDLAERALLGQHILGVEPGGARGEGERSGSWRGRGCAAARARGWARAHICPCKRQAQSLHLPRSAEKRYDNERTCGAHSLEAVFRPPPLVFSVYPFLRRAPRLCFACAGSSICYCLLLGGRMGGPPSWHSARSGHRAADLALWHSSVVQMSAAIKIRMAYGEFCF